MKPIIALMTALTLLTSCSKDDDNLDPEEVIPEITLRVTDCPTEAIGMEIKPRILGKPGRWFVEVKVAITCMDEPVNEAEVKVKYGWISDSFKVKTNDKGETKHRQKVTSTARPSGKITVTIEGSDGEKPKTIEF